MSIVPFHFLLNLEILVSQCFTDLLRLKSQNAFKCVFLGAEHLHFAFVEVELLSQLTDHILMKQSMGQLMLDEW